VFALEELRADDAGVEAQYIHQASST
jgi:hypothetical protein